jgi:hypothetical protein
MVCWRSCDVDERTGRSVVNRKVTAWLAAALISIGSAGPLAGPASDGFSATGEICPERVA